MAMADIEEVADYACADADITLRLKNILESRAAPGRTMATFQRSGDASGSGAGSYGEKRGCFRYRAAAGYVS